MDKVDWFQKLRGNKGEEERVERRSEGLGQLLEVKQKTEETGSRR
jgi:hypothetical protein